MSAVEVTLRGAAVECLDVGGHTSLSAAVGRFGGRRSGGRLALGFGLAALSFVRRRGARGLAASGSGGGATGGAASAVGEDGASIGASATSVRTGRTDG